MLHWSGAGALLLLNSSVFQAGKFLLVLNPSVRSNTPFLFHSTNQNPAAHRARIKLKINIVVVKNSRIFKFLLTISIAWLLRDHNNCLSYVQNI